MPINPGALPLSWYQDARGTPPVLPPGFMSPDMEPAPQVQPSPAETARGIAAGLIGGLPGNVGLPGPSGPPGTPPLPASNSRADLAAWAGGAPGPTGYVSPGGANANGVLASREVPGTRRLSEAEYNGLNAPGGDPFPAYRSLQAGGSNAQPTLPGGLAGGSAVLSNLAQQQAAVDQLVGQRPTSGGTLEGVNTLAARTQDWIARRDELNRRMGGLGAEQQARDQQFDPRSATSTSAGAALIAAHAEADRIRGFTPAGGGPRVPGALETASEQGSMPRQQQAQLASMYNGLAAADLAAGNDPATFHSRVWSRTNLANPFAPPTPAAAAGAAGGGAGRTTPNTTTTQALPPGGGHGQGTLDRMTNSYNQILAGQNPGTVRPADRRLTDPRAAINDWINGLGQDFVQSHIGPVLEYMSQPNIFGTRATESWFSRSSPERVMLMDAINRVAPNTVSARFGPGIERAIGTRSPEDANPASGTFRVPPGGILPRPPQ